MAGRRWFPTEAVESQLLATILLAAATAGLLLTVMTRSAGPGGGGRPLLPLLLACAPVVFLRRWPLLGLAVLSFASFAKRRASLQALDEFPDHGI